MSNRFPILFIIFMAVLMGIYYSLPSAFIDGYLVRWFAVVPGGIVIDWLTSDITVITEGSRIITPIARLNVLKGCEGTEVLLILYAAIIAARAPWIKSLTGFIAGTVAVFILNQIRIAGLFFVTAYHRDMFELFHGFLAPVLIILAVAGLFYLWMRWWPIDATVES